MKRYGMLDNIKSPADLREMSYESLGGLCASIREFIVDSVSATGGHLASNLGVVELSVALEREFDSSRDRIIYDVGHQSYVHKILTGRKDMFPTLRKYGGLSGFMRPEESITDPCITGHASSSLSVALGMAHARTLKNQKYHVVAVIGDGAMTGGMAYEALSSAGTSGEPLLVVLNDNNMSIARNVGGLSRHLSRLRSRPGYLKAKTRVKGRLAGMPGGKAATRLISRLKARFKRLMLPTTLFEQMGFIYLGPVDGHDIKSVCELLSQAKKIKKPVLLHVITQKGKGYGPSERKPELYHGVSCFDPSEGIKETSGAGDFSGCFGAALCGLAEKDSRICAVTAAMPAGTGLSAFAEKFPTRFFDVGIAEEHAVAMAAGMAAQGLVPVAAIYSTFLQRAYDQIVHDIAIAALHVVICVDRAGIVGADGATHNGVLDVAYLRSIPGVKIFCPSNFAELRGMLTQAVYHEDGPIVIRYPRGVEGTFREDASGGPAVCVHSGGGLDVTIVAYGIMVDEALGAATLLEERGIHAQVWKLNEIGVGLEDALGHIEGNCAEWCVALEDVIQNGGVGECMAAYHKGMTTLLNVGNRFLPHGGVREIMKHCGIDAESVADYIIERIRKEKPGNGEETS